jgi:hypothetical protein
MPDVTAPLAPGEFYRKFKDDDPEVVRQKAFQLGVEIGRNLIKERNITGDDLHAIAKVVNAFLWEMAMPVTVRGDKAVLTSNALCPLMAAHLSQGIPWKWLCQNLGWPLMRGLAHAVNPKADMKSGSWRAEGASHCEHIFEIK